MAEAGIPEFVQDNQSFSYKNVLRGLHFQYEPYSQGKLVRVVTGSVLDVVVDLRKSSPQFGRYFKLVLESSRKNMLYVPPGFAHGFVALEDSIFHYKCTRVYHRESESGILWNDPTLDIDWEVKNPLISAKDKALPSFEEATKKLV
jgi:dTDP-4-dehydrorhamnose 3,5-epimerase